MDLYYKKVDYNTINTFKHIYYIIIIMVFLIDKYKINSLSRVICHKPIYKSLFNGHQYSDNLSEWDKYPSTEETNNKLMSIKSDKEFYKFIKNHIRTNNTNLIEYSKRYVQMPNLLIYGQHGSGKRTLINLLLEDIYDKDVHDLKKVSYQLTGYGNKSEEVLIEQSNYHIIIEPTNSGFDKYLIHEIVKEYARQTILNVHNCKTPFRVVLINNIDNLSYYAQTSLRCTMEKYHKTCKFILCGYQVSKIIEPLRSRCLNIRIPCPTFKELTSIIFDISCRENIDIDDKQIYRIVKTANGNIKNAIFLLDLYKAKIKNYELSWKENLEQIIDIIFRFESAPSSSTYNGSIIQKIRELLYIIFITNIPGDQIIIELMNKLLTKCQNLDPILLTIIVQIFGYYETRINKGKRSIIHLEALINSIFYHIMNYKMQSKSKNIEL